MIDFQLHPQLSGDTQWLGDLPLCQVLLANDSRYPWLILVPRRAGTRELHELSEAQQQQFMRESSAVSQLMASELAADKINIAALGNMVPQLHVHHVARFTSDAAWPAPIWGKLPALAYAELTAEVEQWQQRLSTLSDFTSSDLDRKY